MEQIKKEENVDVSPSIDSPNENNNSVVEEKNDCLQIENKTEQNETNETQDSLTNKSQSYHQNRGEILSLLNDWKISSTEQNFSKIIDGMTNSDDLRKLSGIQEEM